MKQKEETISVHMKLPTPFVNFLDTKAAEKNINRTALVKDIIATYIAEPISTNFEIGQKIILAHTKAANALNYNKLYFPNKNNPYLEDTVNALSELCSTLK